MARICELTGNPHEGQHYLAQWQTQEAGRHRHAHHCHYEARFFPNLQRVKAVVNGEVRYVRVAASAIKKGLVIKAPKRNWKKGEAAPK